MNLKISGKSRSIYLTKREDIVIIKKQSLLCFFLYRKVYDWGKRCSMQRVYSLLVDNNSGVLSRISGLFSRRGYSIDSISAGVTADPRFTRITIVASGDELILSQIEKQVRKLEDVIEIKVLRPEDSVYRELIMVKVRANKAERAEIISVADIFRAKIVDVEKDSLMVELTGTKSKLEAFLNLLEGYEILELARTGITGLSRGIKDVTLIDQEGNIEVL